MFGLVTVADSHNAGTLSKMKTPKTYIVTWQTVIDINPTDDEYSDRLWAVIKAEENFKQIMETPDAGDNYFAVDLADNRPSDKSYVTLDEARRIYQGHENQQ